MATLRQVRDKADAKLVQFWQELQAKQDAYYAKHGKYFQLLVTGGRGVENGEEYDFALKTASHELYAIDINFAWTEKLPFEIRIDEWFGPESVGYQGQVWADYQGTVYTRVRRSDGIDSGWYEYNENAI